MPLFNRLFLFLRTKKGKAAVLIFLLLIWYVFCLPSRLFHDPLSTVLEDDQGIMLSARIASDGQWRFPYDEKVPEKFASALIEYEDRHFYQHPGFNPGALLRALKQDLKEKTGCKRREYTQHAGHPSFQER